jgi:23S rRNA pseudouridine1911/1915/1917 synthase
MHPGAGCNNGTLANGLLFRFPELKLLPRAGIVHRLDKDTSGILLVARTEKFRNHFVNLLQERRVNKIYKALIVGKVIGSFEITDAIGRDKNNRTKMSVRADGKDAHTFVKLDKNLGSYSLLDISIKTGRTHQIRVHLSSKKLPIIGDKTYNPSSNIAKGTPMVLTDIIRDFPRQALHSYHLSFEDIDTNETRTFEAPIPDAITNLCNILEKHI